MSDRKPLVTGHVGYSPDYKSPQVMVARPLWEQVREDLPRLRADLAKAQAESEAAAKRWDEENASLAAQLAKSQARCAELEAALLRYGQHRDACESKLTGLCDCGLAGMKYATPGKALAAVRLAQRLVRHCAEPGLVGFAEWRALVKETQEALDAAFGSGE